MSEASRGWQGSALVPTDFNADLRRLLPTLGFALRPDTYVYAHVGEPAIVSGVAALVAEDEGWTVVCTRTTAERERWTYTFEAGWITVETTSDLELVGLTMVLSTWLADAGIACNVLAGRWHDHLLVPVEHADRAMALLRDRSGRPVPPL